jgi:hypothetical protein
MSDRRRCRRAGLLLLGLVLSGCAEQPKNEPPQRTTAVAIDCSKSMRGDQNTWPQQMAGVTAKAVQDDGLFLAGCFSAKASVDWTFKRDGRLVPRKMTGGESARRRWAATWGLLQEKPLESVVRTDVRGGTNWLGALEATGRLPGLTTAFVFTDLIQQAEDVDLTEPLRESELDAIADRWAPRLRRLKGRTVYIIGAGQGVHRSQAARRGERLFLMLRDRVGFAPISEIYGTVPATESAQAY